MNVLTMANNHGNSSRKGNLISRTSRIVLALLGLLILLLGSGAIYQIIATARDKQAYPPPGQLVDVGGYRLHIHCLGTGMPTVVTENGLGGSSPDWRLVQLAVSHITRICSYDRAGAGWSEAGSGPRTSRQISAELHTLLTNAGLPGPYVLVGHSAGGMHAQVYAGQYPADVAGLVLVDPTPAQAINRFSPEQRRAILPDSGQIRLLKVMQFFGLLRFLPLSDEPVLASLPPATQAQIRAHRLQSGAVAAMLAEADSLETSINQTAEATPLPANRPLLIVWRDIPAEHDELEAPARASMEELVQQSGNSKFVVAEKSGHFITFERPDVVIDAIGQVVEAVRTERPLK